MKRNFSDRQQRRGNVRDLLTRGIAAAKAGEREEARFYLEWLLITDPTEDDRMEARFWLAEISEDATEKRHYLEEILSRRPAHARARRLLAIVDGRLQAEEIVDPDALAAGRQIDEDPAPAAARQFRCPRCAARLVFTPDGAALHCEHCGYRQTLEGDGAVHESDFIVAMATTRGHLKPVSTPTFSCPSCTASYLLSAGALTVTCPYCHHTYTVETAETRRLAPPQGLIPFVVSETLVARALQGWLTQHKLRPKAPLHGLYLPAWTFDVGGNVDWQGQNVAYEDSDGRWNTVSGSHPLYADDLIVPACNTLPLPLQPLLQSFNLDDLLAFEESFLAAWPAQTYEVTVGDASLVARRQAFQRGRDEVRRNQQGLNNLRFSSAGVTIISYKLILLPVWLAHYHHEGRSFTLALNGQTGQLLAEYTPRSGLLSSLGRWFAGLVSGK